MPALTLRVQGGAVVKMSDVFELPLYDSNGTLRDDDDQFIGETSSSIDAEVIVRAVNAHDAMYEALKRLTDKAQGEINAYAEHELASIIEQARAALALAEGRS